MRVLYEKLLLTDDYRVTSIKEYLDNLIDEIIKLFPENINLTIEKQFHDFQTNPRQLFSIGIIVNELLTNSVKYAFAGKESGLIKVSVTENEGNAILTIQDDGNGLAEGFDVNAQRGFGLMLVDVLSQQLGGSFTIENNNGARSTLKFPV
jgi:two-component sensor histidine kinase